MATTAALSHRTWIVVPPRCEPHIAAAITMRISSFLVMLWDSNCSAHFNWNHSVPANAPQPQLPEASDVRITDGVVRDTDFIIATPFEALANLCHHSMSERVSLLSQIKWSRWLALVERSISLRRPDLNTLLYMHGRGSQLAIGAPSSCILFPPPCNEEISQSVQLFLR